MKDQAEEMDNVALTPQEAMAGIEIYKYTHINSFLKMQAFTKHDGITLVANNCKPVGMRLLACFALLGLRYKKSVLMRHI